MGSSPLYPATSTALALKAPLASPVFTGTPTAPTAAAATSTTQIATTAHVHAAIAAQAGVSQWLTIPITSTPTGAVQDSGHTLPAISIISEVLLEVTVPETVGSGGNGTISVGVIGEINKLLNAMLAGYVGTFQGTHAYDGSNRGTAMLAQLQEDPPIKGVMSAFLPTSITVSYQASGADWTAFRGKIHILYFNPPA